MKTVLFLTQTARPVGGVQTRVEQLDRLLPARGWNVRVGLAWGNVFHSPEKFLAQHPLSHPIHLDGRTGTAAGRRLAIRKAIRTTRADVVVPLCLFDVFPVVAALKRTAGTPRLLFPSCEWSPSLALDLCAYRGVLDQTIAVGALLTDLLVNVVGLERGRVLRLPGGIPLPQRVDRPSPEKPLRIGHIGRLDPAKRPLDLVPLCEELERRGVDYHLTVIGQGLLEGDVRAALASRIARGAVTFQGPVHVDELYRSVYPHLDGIVLFSATGEGVPLALVEAMAHGVVPLTSDFPGRGLEGLMNHEETALVFPIGRTDLAASHLERLAQDGGLWARLSQAARAIACERHGLNQMVERWATVLDRMLEREPLRGRASVGLNGTAGRLDRWLGSAVGEWVRRALGRQAPHADASEWPHTYPWPAAELEAMERRMREVERQSLAGTEVPVPA